MLVMPYRGFDFDFYLKARLPFKGTDTCDFFIILASGSFWDICSFKWFYIFAKHVKPLIPDNTVKGRYSHS